MTAGRPQAPGAAATPSISVIIPVFRAAAVVRDAIAAVAAQTVRPDEVLLVDDRGQDVSMAVAQGAADNYGLPWRSLFQPGNLGPGPARNAGLAGATGDLIWFLDSDDSADPRFLEIMSRALIDHDAQVAVCRTLRVGPDGAAAVDEPGYDDSMVDGASFARGMLKNRYRGYACNKLFRLAELPAHFFDERRAYEDFTPILRLALRCKRFALVDEPLYRYTRNPASVSAQFTAHTTDLFAVADDVRAELTTTGRLPQWQREFAIYQVVNVVMPVANLAIRAQHAGDRSAQARDAVAAARRRLSIRELRALLFDRRWRMLLAMSILKASPRLYSYLLRSR